MSGQTGPGPARRKVYPSDVTDEQWHMVLPLLPIETMGRPRCHSLREQLNAMNYRWSTQCAWRMLPHDFPPWETVYKLHYKWRLLGLARVIREQLEATSARRGVLDRSRPVERSMGEVRGRGGFSSPLGPAGPASSRTDGGPWECVGGGVESSSTLG